MNLEGLEALLLLLYRQPATLSIWRPCCILHPALSLTLAALQDPFTPVTLGPASPFSTWELQVPRGHFFLLTHQYMRLQLQVEFVITCPFSLAPLSPPTASCPLTSSTCQSLRRALSSVIGHSLCTHNLLVFTSSSLLRLFPPPGRQILQNSFLSENSFQKLCLPKSICISYLAPPSAQVFGVGSVFYMSVLLLFLTYW